MTRMNVDARALFQLVYWDVRMCGMLLVAVYTKVPASSHAEMVEKGTSDRGSRRRMTGV